MKIIKRDKSVVSFDLDKVENAIQKAAVEIGPRISVPEMETILKSIMEKVREEKDLSVEKVQDFVEETLMEKGLYKTAKAYILYREKRNALREQGWDMTDLQRDILHNKYMYEDEGFDGFVKRVGYENAPVQKLVRNKKFLPAGRILFGRRLFEYGKKVTYSNCFVITPPEDTLESIFDTARSMAKTYSHGGGCGTSLEYLRPRGAKVNNSAKITTGAVSFMDLYSMTTGLIGQNARRGALMLSLPVSHPDIEEFIRVKSDLNKVTFANISVMVSDEFMRAVKNDEEWEMRFEVKDTKEVISKKTNARSLMRLIAANNWDMAEPGFLFWDRVTGYHLNSEDPEFKYASTNPCGEKPLPSGGSCLLGSLNLDAYYKNGYYEMDRFAADVRVATRYLDDVLEEGLELLPLEEQKVAVAKYRQLGLGIMGFADLLINMGVRYGSKASIEVIDQIGSVMINMALQESAIMAKERGAYPAYKEKYVLNSPFLKEVAWPETIDLIKKHGLRNAELLSIAPTGSISTMLGVSGGMEPMFMISYTRESKTLHNDGPTFYKVFTPIAKEYMEKHNITEEEDLPDFFVTSATLNYRERVDVQAAWQKYIDAAISSTVNVPNEFTVEEVEDLYIYAWEKGLKGITLYRDGCARTGILTTEKTEKKKDVKEVDTKIEKEKAPTCPDCGGEMKVSNGCEECLDCGFSPCSI